MNTRIAAYAAMGPRDRLVPYEYEPEALGPHDVEVAVTHCGVCHSDVHLIDNDWSVSEYPLVPGHEVVGQVVAAGPAAGLELGARVGIGWQCASCHECEQCVAGRENLCATQRATCVGHMGGFGQRIRVDSRFAFVLPAALVSTSAAPLLCGGVTVYAPLRRWGVRPGARVGVIGVGGLGHLALRFLDAMGCHAVAFTSSPDKGDEAVRLGARHVASSVQPREILAFSGQLEMVLCTAPVRVDWTSYLQTLKPNGVFCLVGAPKGLMQIPPSLLTTGQRVVCGSDIGSPAAIREMLAFAAERGIGAEVETLPMSEANAAVQRVRENKARYRMVLVAGG